jgi:hypothetical protein
MILEKQKEAMVFADGEINESIGMSLDLDSAQILMQMLSKNLYSDSIGSTIRECASNALDSHRRAGVEDPIVVSFKLDDNNNYLFSVEDFGVGLNDDDVRNIISKYGKSTKRNSNTELGMMGLGFKAPLAYSSSFYFICRKDNIERKYMMYEGEDTNTIDRLYERPTAEGNGVKVIIPVKWSDRFSFYDKIQEQLAYFDSVYLDVTAGGYSLNNKFTIYRSEHFQYSEMSKDDHLHICLDNVYYPLDFGKLGISHLEFPVALRFSLSDGVFPTPNREAIRYTQEAKDIILERLGQMSDFFVEKYNREMGNCTTFNQVIEYYTSKKRSVEIIPGKSLNVGYLSIFSNVVMNEPKMEGVKHLDLKKLVDKSDYILNEYAVTYTLNRGKFKEVKGGSYEANVIRNNVMGNNTYMYSSRISELKKAYLRTHLQNGTYSNYYFVKRTGTFSLFSKSDGSSYIKSLKRNDNYYQLLELSKIKKEHWREAIIEFQGIVKSMLSGFKNLDDVVVPDSFIQSRKQTNLKKNGGTRREKLAGDIIVKKAAPLERFVDGKHCKFVADTWSLKEIAKKKTLIVYSHHDDSLKLDKLYGISYGKMNITIISLSTKEMKVLEELELNNVMSYSKFMEGTNKPFKKLVTAYVINKLMLDQAYVFRKYTYLKNVSSELINKLSLLEDYRNKNYRDGSTEIYTAMFELAQEKNLFDYSIYHEYIQMKATLEKLYFLNSLLGSLNLYSYNTSMSPGVERAIVDLMKYHKFKVNLDHYTRLEEDKLEEQFC